MLAGFGILWGFVGASGIDEPVVAIVARVAAVVISATLAWFAVWGSVPSETEPAELPEDWERRFGRVNLMQVLAIAVVVAVFVAAGAPRFVPPIVCAVVGLHFLPLARVFAEREYRVTGAVLIAVGVVGLVLLAVASPEASRGTVGFGAAVCLWGTGGQLIRLG